MKTAPQFQPKNQKDWRKWLSKNHQAEEAIWLILFKKKSADFNLSWSEAVDEALCFGWIDSTKKTIDEERYQQYFTKRKPKSNWSKVNKQKVDMLIEQGLMEEAGYKSIAIAKENGSWTLLDQVEALEVPDDLMVALKKEHGAYDFFDVLSKSDKKILLYWVISAKRPATKEKRIEEIATNANEGKKPTQFRS